MLLAGSMIKDMIPL